jgi:DNA-binding NarL/FixJ family response regulator
MNRVFRVLIAEDHFLARIALRGMLNTLSGFEVVAETNAGDEAIRLYREHRPDVVIMDLKLNGVSGFSAIRGIRSEFPGARILVVSDFQGSEDIYQAIHAGARGYLTKDADGPQLAYALTLVASGGRYLPDWLEGKLANRTAGPPITPREKAVLQLLAEGLSTIDIANRIQVAEKTVRIHISNMLEKLGARDRTQALVLALQRGIIHLDS